jgi:two-component system chemotaxis response regulator CheB
MIRALIVDDSALSRAVLKEVLEADGDIVVVGEADNGAAALPRVLELKPDIVTMDIDMPGVNGLGAIERIMQSSPVPILVVTGERLGPETDLGFKALHIGALDFLPKPAVTDDAATTRLRVHVRTLCKVNVGERPPETVMPPAVDTDHPMEIIAIGSGTGGPSVIAQFVRALPEDFPCPIAIVQQMPQRFATSFARSIQAFTNLRVQLVTAMPHEMCGGDVILVDADAHLYCPCRGVLVAIDAPPSAGHRPSANVLMRSIAEAYGRSAIGIVLSGSGEDGLDGLRALRSVGGLTIAQAPQTALVPDVVTKAVKQDLVDRAVPSELLADFVLSTVTEAKSKTTAPPSDPTS